MNTLLKPIILWATVIFTLAIAFMDGATSAFPNGLVEASQAKDKPGKTPGKATEKIFKKLKSKAAKKAWKIKKAAKEKASQASDNPFQGVQERIRLLNDKIDLLESERTPTATPASALSDGNDQPSAPM